MGTIQPARFLSRTGEIFPGVRRVVQVANPAAGNDWSVAVPGGVQWLILAGNATLTTSATVASREVYGNLYVQNELVFKQPGLGGIAASTVTSLNIVTDPGLLANYEAYSNGLIPSPLIPLPPGTIVSVTTTNLQVGDQWSGIMIWVEEYYFTDSQLSEIERAKEAAERALIAAELQQAGIGQGN